MSQYVKKGYKRKIDIAKAVAMYEAGHSVKQISSLFGATRQAVYAALSKAGIHTPRLIRERPLIPAISDKEYAEMWKRIEDRIASSVEERIRIDRIKNAARVVAYKAVARGELNPEPCEVCGQNGRTTDGRRGIHAHHDDYSKPLSVRWLCERHHKEWHKHNKAKV